MTFDRCSEQLIVALDVPTAQCALELVAALGDVVGYFKIGKQLFTAKGPALVQELVAAGHRVFLDLKYHDIPNTVAGAVSSAAALGVSMLTLHAAGGSKMLRAAAEAALKAERRPALLAVTVLTSMNDADLAEIGVSGRVIDQVLRLAALARNCGMDGIVASPHECREIRREVGVGFSIVTPGVRPRGTGPDDQARVMSPGEAIAAGATHVVVGRPITEAKDPHVAAVAIAEEIAAAKANLKRGSS